MTPATSECAQILAPYGRDAYIAQSILGEAKVDSAICSTLEELVAGLGQGAGFALITEDSLKGVDLSGLSDWIGGQEKWSDFPFILLTSKGGGIERNPAAARFLDLLGNVTFLERPFHPTTFISVAQSALRARRRQYEARSTLQELHAGAAKYQSLFNSIEAGFCIIEMVFDAGGAAVDFTFVETNPAFGRQTGLFEVTGRRMTELVPDHEAYWFEIYGKVATTREPVRFESHAAALGDIWYEVYAFPAGEANSSQVAVLFNDVTSRRQMEMELRENEERLHRLNESLEERVTHRTRELTQAQDQLRQAQKLEAIGQLTGGVAHDFNNLLMAVLSSLTLLRKRVPDDPALHQLIDNAVQGAERGAALTQRMLAFARKQDLTSESIDLAALVRSMSGLLERTLGPVWPLELQLHDAYPPVSGDRNQVEMALLNLTLNARDAMAEGGVVRIIMEGRTVAAAEPSADGLAPGRYVGLTVDDTGQGMDAATLERATEPFFTTKGIGKGTGLGLPMVHGLAKQLEGSFQLTSQLGRGTKATLWLPAAEENEHMPLPSPVLPVEPPHPSRLKVLAVDDDLLVLMNTAALLEDLGHEVLEASSGEAGLKLLLEHREIDLLITDQAMPGMTGAQLVQEVAKVLPDLPIILATGYGEVPPGFKQSVIKLSKPFSQMQLEQALALALDPARDHLARQ